MPIVKIVPMPGPQGPQGPAGNGEGGDANIADFVFTSGEGQSTISLPGDKGMKIEAGVDSDLYLTAGDDLYIQTLGYGDDIHLNAADDIRFTTNNEDSAFATAPAWRMDSEGLFQLPGNGYISNPYTETIAAGTYTVSFSDNYLNNQSGLNQAYSVALPVIQDSLWFVNNYTITSPVTITFADSTTTTTVAIYDATSQGTPAVIFQWDDQERNKTFTDTFPLTISADYNQVQYGGSPIVLDPEWYGNDQKIVIDATAPNHIHVRAGGNIDESTAELILGGERNKVAVSDSSKSVAITTAATIENTFVNANEVGNADLIVPDTSDILIGDNIVMFGASYPVTYFSPDPNNTGFSIVRATGATFVAGDSYTFVREEPYDNYWQFTSTGVFSGPAMGGVKVPAISNSAEGNDLYVYANEADVNIQANDGAVTIDAPEINITSNAVPAFLNINTYGGAVVNSNRTSEYAPEDKVVATLGDIEQAIETGPSEVSFTVNGGTLGTQPTFDGAPLFSGTYVKVGPQVHFQIQVDMDNITNFGTGQYYVDLPFPAKYGYQVREGCLHDISTERQYAIGGHVFAGQSRLNLFFTDTNGQDQEFDHNSPITLNIADNFHIAGTYIIDTEAP